MAAKVIKEIVTDVGGNTTIEYSDDTTQKYNVADVVTAQSNPVTGGIRSQVSGVGIGPVYLAPKNRQVANRCITTDTYSTSYKQSMSVRYHKLFDFSSAGIVLGFTSYAIQGGNPGFGSPTPSTFTASVEYPAGSGVRQQVKFSGSSSGVETLGQILYSDPIVLSGLPGQEAIVRVWQSNATGITHCSSGGGYRSTEGQQLSATTTPDVTMSGSTGIGSGYMSGMVCSITSLSSFPAAYIAGDSIGRGQQDAGNVTGMCGVIDRSIGMDMPYINVSAPGAKMQDWNSSGHLVNIFSTLAAFCDVAVLQAGTNDIFLGSRTDTNVRADLVGAMTKLNTLKSGIKCLAVSVLPQTTSTDSWATTANQTVKAGEVYRVAYNRSLGTDSTLLSNANFAGAFNVCPAIESAPDSGIINASRTADGVHPNTLAHSEIETSGRVDSRKLLRLIF